MSIRAIIAAVVWLITQFSTFATPQQLASGANIASPNGCFTAVYNPDQLEIQSHTTDRPYRIDGVLPVYALKWTDDSKTLGIVHHLAGGSGLVLAHFDGTAWRHSAVTPPEGYDRVAVVKIDSRKSIFVVSWKITRMTRTTATYYLFEAVAQPTKPHLSNVRITEISAQKFDSLPLLGES